jgi:hypothetical protein
MRLAALRQLLGDNSEVISEVKRLEIWKTIEKLQDVIEEWKKSKKK